MVYIQVSILAPSGWKKVYIYYSYIILSFQQISNLITLFAYVTLKLMQQGSHMAEKPHHFDISLKLPYSIEISIHTKYARNRALHGIAIAAALKEWVQVNQLRRLLPVSLEQM